MFFFVNLCTYVVVLTLEASSAEAERLFSKLNHIRSSRRSQLKISAVSDIMAIMSHVNPKNYMCLPAVVNWNKQAEQSDMPTNADTASTSKDGNIEDEDSDY